MNNATRTDHPVDVLNETIAVSSFLEIAFTALSAEEYQYLFDMDDACEGLLHIMRRVVQNLRYIKQHE